MTDRSPTDTTNLDRYGFPELPWSRPHAILETGNFSEAIPWFLGTVGIDGRPHAAGVGATWDQGDLYFTSGPGTKKSRNLVANAACTISTKLEGIDLVFEGDATHVTDDETLRRIAAQYRAGGWPAEVADGAFTAPFSAPSAGPPPWYLYRFTYRTVFGVATAEPYGATRWRFDGR